MTYVAYLTVINNGKYKEWAFKNIIGMSAILEIARSCIFNELCYSS